MMIIRYIQAGVLVALVLAGFYIKHLLGVNEAIQAELAVIQAQAETNAKNLKLVVQQLDRESEYRLIAESALAGLNKDVPDVEYQQTLPPNIQNVVDRFHRSIRRNTP